MPFLTRHQRSFKSSTGTTVTLNADTLRLEMEADHGLWFTQNRLEIPLANISEALYDPIVAHDRPWSPAPAVSLPGSIVLGSAAMYGDLVFWNVHDSDRAVAIQLRDHSRTWLVVAVDDPDALVLAMNDALGGADRHHPVEPLSQMPAAAVGAHTPSGIEA